MEIDPPSGKEAQRFWAEDLSVTHYDEDLRIEPPHLLPKIGIELLRLQDGKIQVQGLGLDRVLGTLPPPPRPLVGMGQDRDDIVVFGNYTKRGNAYL